MTGKSDPEGTLQRPLDEKYIFVKKGTTSEQTLPLQTTGQRADCRGRGFQFSSRIFPLGYNFPDPLLIAARFTHLEFSYRTIPLKRIRLACRLIAGAKFSSKNEKARDTGFVTGKKYEATLLTKIAPLFIGGLDLQRLCVQCSMDTVCELCGLACGSFSLMGINDRHLQNEDNEPHSENEKMTVIRKGSPPIHSEMIIISVILK